MANFCEKLGIRDYKKLSSKDLVERLLTCIYQASENSGDVTENAAKTLAKELGADFHSTSIEKVVSSYIDEAEQCLGRSLTWGSDDIALQNVQARARSPLPWILANVRSQILLATSNRSEASVGYTTMDGDSSGGLSPISGIDKDFLRKWLVWVEKDSNLGLGKVKAMKLVNEQQPTAELRPKSMKQTDEDDLMPYDILNNIERYMIRDKMSSNEIVEFLRRDYPNLSQSQIEDYVIKFRGMWRRSQWKRERYAPGFHLDDYSVDPKTWCRFPIISGS